MKTRQQGFAALEAILIVVVLAIIGGTGYYVWHSRQATDKTLSDANKSSNADAKLNVKTFEDCKKAAGSKLLETYPEQCVTKDGKKFTNTTANLQPNTEAWLLYKAPSGHLTIRLADGWSFVRYKKDDYFTTLGSDKALYKAGQIAKVSEVSVGTDGAVLGLSFDYTSDDTSLSDVANGTFKTGEGYMVKKYYKVTTVEPLDDGTPPKGSKIYDYYVSHVGSSTVLHVSYRIGAGDKDEHAVVEAAIKTVHFDH